MQCHVKHETKPLEHMVYPDRLITIAILAFFFRRKRAFVSETMAMMKVQGQVALQRNSAVIKLTPTHQHPNAQPQAWTQRPTPDDIASLIRSGAREVHPSRQPLMRAAVSSSMVTVQRRLGLKLACMDNGQSKLLRLVGMV